MIEGFHEMTDAERRNLLWGLRDGSCGHMNRLRRERFDSVKECLVSRAEYQPAPPSTNVVELANYTPQLQNVAAQLNNIGYPHHRGAQAWPFI